ncbi:MAG: SRPBCC family protein [Candidatus Limnocylindria bacterium]
MRRVESSARIPATADRLFAFVADPANLPRWQSGITAAERTSPDPVGVGSTARVVRELMGQRLAVDLTLTDYQEGRRLGLASSLSGIGVQATLDLAPAGDETDLRFALEIRAESMFMAPMEGMVAGAAEGDIADSLERLRRHFADAA